VAENSVIPSRSGYSKSLREVREHLADVLDVLHRKVDADFLVIKQVKPQVVDVNIYAVHRTKLRSSNP
jgi:hypothetical protein